MKDAKNIQKSRNARLNLARREAEKLVTLLDPAVRPGEDEAEAWKVILAEIRDAANDITQACHEANAYHNCLAADAAPKVVTALGITMSGDTALE